MDANDYGSAMPGRLRHMRVCEEENDEQPDVDRVHRAAAETDR